MASKRDNLHLNHIYRKAHDDEHLHFLAMIDRFPTADVEQVTRCKNCYQSVVIDDVLHCTYWGKDTDENGYCHEGG